MPECLICTEDQAIMTVGNCEHPFVCLECTYKCRQINANTRCIYCNQQLDEVVTVKDVNTSFVELSKLPLNRFKAGIFYFDDESRRACFKLESMNCVIKKCGKQFADLKFLKTHLKDAHKRYFCDLCLENRALLVNEQTIYRLEELNTHMDKGDFDEEDNLVSLHPYCDFCNKYFFNEEQFTSHMRKDHMKCHLCTTEKHKWMYYAKYENLATHFKMSHYMCNYPECVEKCFIAYKTQDELDRHVNQAHTGGAKKGTRILTVGPMVVEEEKIVDKEGIDFSNRVSLEDFVNQTDSHACPWRHNG
jgi:hypothetical protein